MEVSFMSTSRLSLQALSPPTPTPCNSLSRIFRNPRLGCCPIKPKTLQKTLYISTQPSSIRASATPQLLPPQTSFCDHWLVVVEKPQNGALSKAQVIDYYVETLAEVLGSKKEAQMCIYDASWQTHFGFCCVIDEESSTKLSSLPEVLSVRPDSDIESSNKDYSTDKGSKQGDYSFNIFSNLSNLNNGNQVAISEASPPQVSKYWLVRMEKPRVMVITKPQMVDYYAQTLTKVLGNEKDAQMCIYHVSWQTNFGFCCELDHDDAKELAGVPGVLSVQPDTNFESEVKDYGGVSNPLKSTESTDSSNDPPIRTKRLFVTGLSFYTSEKTLRAEFEGFGKLVDVKIIMDKISKRSKGYGFIEYTTEEAASAALKEMNGKIINGWMIVVDVAKTNPPRYNRDRPRTMT
ncbi:hypothetical protein AMTRI_Chr04g250720 [Amborella trichopoda]